MAIAARAASRLTPRDPLCRRQTGRRAAASGLAPSAHWTCKRAAAGQYRPSRRLIIRNPSAKVAKYPSNKALLPFGILAPVTAVISVWFGLSSFFYCINDYENAVKIYPSYTEAQKIQLLNAKTDTEMGKIADSILKHNPYLSIANDAKARVAFSNGDIIGMMGYKESAIKFNRYDLSEYLDYFDMLNYATNLYVKNNDYQSAEYCIDRCSRLRNDLKTVEESTSKLGRMIDDQPDLELPAEYADYLDLLENLKET